MTDKVLWVYGQDPAPRKLVMPYTFVKQHYERERIAHVCVNGHRCEGDTGRCPRCGGQVRRVRVHVDDSATVKHVEENDRLHAVVRPRTTVYTFGDPKKGQR